MNGNLTDSIHAFTCILNGFKQPSGYTLPMIFFFNKKHTNMVLSSRCDDSCQFIILFPAPKGYLSFFILLNVRMIKYKFLEFLNALFRVIRCLEFLEYGPY